MEDERLVSEILLDRLPRPGTEWPLYQRVRLLRALVAFWDLDYEQSDADLGEEDAHIVVKLLVRADADEFAEVLHQEDVPIPGAN